MQPPLYSRLKARPSPFARARTSPRSNRSSEDCSVQDQTNTWPVPLTSPTLAQVAVFYRKVFDRYRRLDVLVNNAGILGDAVIGMIGDDLIDNTLATNVKGAIYNLQAAARLMQRKKTGSIINLSSIIGTRGNRGQTVYGASKAAIIGLTQSAAKDLAPANIRVNAIAPGYIDTPMIAHLDPATHATRIANIGLGRVGKAEEVANAILFLASDLSSYVTGQVLGVDGGMVI